MKKFCFILFFLALTFPTISKAQRPDYRVVFDLTSKDSVNQALVIRWIHEIIDNNPEAKVEVVLFAQGVDFVVKDKSVAGNEVTKLSGNKNISFRICAIAMKNHHLDKSQLLPGVEIVPDGIYEIVSKQREGWGYVKVSH
jgi:intracellular sulfur oxidation DsrE/DsrF family protein